MYIFNKITAVAVGALISLINATEYEVSTEIYDGENQIIGWRNKKILMTNNCLIRLHTVVPNSTHLDIFGDCEITTTNKEGSATGSMIIKVKVNDLNDGFGGPDVSITNDIEDIILDSAEDIIAALKTVI